MTAANKEGNSPVIGTKEPEQEGDLANMAKGSSQAGPFGRISKALFNEPLQTASLTDVIVAPKGYRPRESC